MTHGSLLLVEGARHWPLRAGGLALGLGAVVLGLCLVAQGGMALVLGVPLILAGLARCAWCETLWTEAGHYHLLCGWLWSIREYRGSTSELRLDCRVCQDDGVGFVCYAIELATDTGAWPNLQLGRYSEWSRAVAAGQRWAERLALPFHRPSWPLD